MKTLIRILFFVSLAGCLAAAPTTQIGVAAGTSLSLSAGVSTGVGGTAAGTLELTQGTAPTAGTTSIKFFAPAAVTSHIRQYAGAAATGFSFWTNTAGTVVETFATFTGTGNVMLAVSPTTTGTLTGSAANFSGALTATTLNTGNGANELFAMDQNVRTTDQPTFSNVQMIPSTLTYAGTTNLDFSAIDGKKIITLTGNVTFTTSNLASGKSVRIKLVASGGPWTLTFPGGWIFIGAAAPSSLASGKTAILTLDSDTTADSGVVAAYSAAP